MYERETAFSRYKSYIWWYSSPSAYAVFKSGQEPAVTRESCVFFFHNLKEPRPPSQFLYAVKYKLDLMGLQEVRWDKGGTKRAEYCTFFFVEG